MMMSSQAQRAQALEDLKDSSNVILCYRCSRAIPAVDRFNEVGKTLQGGAGDKQMKIHQMFNFTQSDRVMSEGMHQTKNINNSDEIMMESSQTRGASQNDFDLDNLMSEDLNTGF